MMYAPPVPHFMLRLRRFANFPPPCSPLRSTPLFWPSRTQHPFPMLGASPPNGRNCRLSYSLQFPRRSQIPILAGQLAGRAPAGRNQHSSEALPENSGFQLPTPPSPDLSGRDRLPGARRGDFAQIQRYFGPARKNCHALIYAAPQMPLDLPVTERPQKSTQSEALRHSASGNVSR